jgi:hypothetical protein
VFVALFIIPFLFVPPPPAAGASAGDVASYYAGHRGALLFGGWVGALALIPSVVFYAGLLTLMRRAEGEGAWVWLVALLSQVGVYATVMVIIGIGAVLPFSAASVNKDIAKVLSDALALTLALYLVPNAAFFAALGWASVSRGALPAWLGYFAYVVAAVCLLGSLGLFVDSGFFKAGSTMSFIAFGVQILWWLAAGILLIARPVEAAMGQGMTSRSVMGAASPTTG